MPHIPDAVRALERDLQAIFGPRLRSLVAYGLAGHGHVRHDDGAGAHGHAPAATHTMAVVDQLTADDLRACAARVADWHDRGLATPLVLGAHEFERSLDAFPLEFGAIVADHVVVAGRPPFESATVDPGDVRRACEVQARSHLLHLREGFLETRGRTDALAVLIVQSAAPLRALVRSVARLQGVDAADPAAASRYAERTIGVDTGVLDEVVALADATEISSPEAARLFPPYLDAVERLVKWIDAR